ncbi:MAG: autoinducer binding domain-containing protein [Burkholderiales bacterium]|nr:autoinducer binding domain-containing protein [Burkholderiales bacterium]MDE1926299.1 autoinducer binding domain-containing protein [Burkholderiales bacterium]MDE2159348.1 autoinducer binding domain-containing protein [Burkholderiales bacterium]MDE2501467.1 autoinducer binding domain-containing protein [Burkholderiales bacterium]
MLSGAYTSVLQSRSRDELREEIVRFTRDLGFETVTAVTMVEHGLGRNEVYIVDNTPAAYAEAYVDPNNSKRDPVLHHCRRQSMPIVWNQATYVERGAGDLWEHQARFGYRTGIAMALHLPEGKHFMLGVDRDQPLPGNSTELQRLVADLQLFAVHAQDAAMRLLLPPAHRPERPALTPRELESLRWTMEGKTAWEVGALLGISERTAVMHVNNAMHKLDCVSKHQAVLKALRLGLID